MNIEPRKILSEADFDLHCLWRSDDATDLCYPIMTAAEIPDYERDLFIRAKFVSPTGIVLKGFRIGGEKHIYCIGIFYKGKKILFNKNMIEYAFDDFDKLRKLLEADLKRTILIADIFPLKYETTVDINLEEFCNFGGEFNAFEKLKDLRLLRWKNI